MASEPRVCPRCGSPAAGSQGICLECGERLEGGRPTESWLMFAAVALAVAAAAAAIVIAIGKDDGVKSVVAPPLTTIAVTTVAPAAATTAVATSTAAASTAAAASTVVPPPTTTVPAPTTTSAATTAPAPTTTQPAAPTTVPGLPGPRLVVWPAGTDGFTVVIASLPTATGARQATERALAAAQRGLPQAGVLVSDAFASLHPGYLVIFSGIYATLAEAQRAAGAAQLLYPGAYSRRIAR